ncbi:hypothetical protein E2C01_009834 [Portunus trituberculatus]|uniref:Uncharacterized protein n=1 Tax=Portunus trituberculatus TaxID=210409 RepID=A0A5B7D6S8_PORTR|nr:hypothetical protein [Portunus trituberculatus]
MRLFDVTWLAWDDQEVLYQNQHLLQTLTRCRDPRKGGSEEESKQGGKKAMRTVLCATDV